MSDTPTIQLEQSVGIIRVIMPGPEGPPGTAGSAEDIQAMIDASLALGGASSVTVNNTLTGVSAVEALSAAQGTVLKGLVDAKAPINSPTFTGTVSGITAEMVGLGVVNNTTDANKPISSATQTALNLKESVANKGAANGYAGLDSSGLIPLANLPVTSTLGAVAYQSSWNAATNYPAIPVAAPENKGWYYIVSVAGNTAISGHSNWIVGDWVVSNGASWDFISTASQVASVAGRTGAVVLSSADVGLPAVENTSDANKPISSATQLALNAKVNTALLGAASGVALLGADSKVPKANMSTLVPADVGLGSVNNTSDANKPVSTAQAAADAVVLASAQSADTNRVPVSAIAITASRALTSADKGATLVNSTGSNYTLTLIPGLGSLTLYQASGGTLVVSAGTAAVSGTLATTTLNPFIKLTELSGGLYVGHALGTAPTVVNDLVTASASQPLSAAQGVALQVGKVNTVGTYTTLEALTAARPPSANIGSFGLVGTVAPYARYVSDGVVWAGVLSASIDPGTLQDVLNVGGTNYALFPLDGSGNAVANVVPRTGTLSNLLSLSGGAGELASATDEPAIVQFTGTPGGATAFYPGAPIYVVPRVLGTNSYVAPLTNKIVMPFVSGAAVANVTISGAPKIGHAVAVEAHQLCTFYASPVSEGCGATFRWSGTSWVRDATTYILPSTTFGGYPPTAIGGAIFSDLSMAVGAVGIGFEADASNTMATILGTGTTFWDGSSVLGISSQIQNTAIHHVVLGGVTTTASQVKTLTLDRGAVTETSVLAIPPVRGSYDIHVLLIANAGNTTSCCRMEREFLVNAASGGATINTPATTGLPSDVNVGMAGASLNIEVNATYNSIDLTVTAPTAAMSTRWAAFLTIKSTGGS